MPIREAGELNEVFPLHPQPELLNFCSDVPRTLFGLEFITQTLYFITTQNCTQTRAKCKDRLISEKLAND